MMLRLEDRVLALVLRVVSAVSSQPMAVVDIGGGGPVAGRCGDVSDPMGVEASEPVMVSVLSPDSSNFTVRVRSAAVSDRRFVPL